MSIESVIDIPTAIIALGFAMLCILYAIIQFIEDFNMSDPVDLTKMPEGSRVSVKMDDGRTIITHTRSKPWQLGHGDWVVLLKGISGGYLLDRVSLIKED